ncbi:uncharacterized protein LOC141685682 [Apium graveolens]|uniref:uncharacterized protein LOC141685682 n=1 Tax=Apium graveolens TaxID=4045 RepID=UPI003D79DEA8
MRHPADSPSWQNVDYRWPTFGNEPRNLRLALATDGINPHNNNLTNRYSCWPVVLVTYNLPPWLCMKRKFMILTVLVSGPHEPGNNIDVFLQSLIDDLKKLWEEGEPIVYDAGTKSFFTLRAILLWTINDFLAYGNLSGCVNQGYMSCPICGDNTFTKYLSHSRKMCYQGHRRYLPRHHPYRRKKAVFNGEQEFGQPHQPFSGEQVLEKQEKIKFTFRNEVKTAKKHKSKDSEASRNDMMEMGIRLDLAPQVGVKRTYLPPSIFTLTKAEKRKVLKSLLSMKLPYGHVSNIKNCVSMADAKLFGLKSHDCHILLQQLFPVTIRSVLPKNVRVSIIRLFFFFNSLCNKVVVVSKLEKLQADVVLILRELEKIFLPSFFDVMIHLTVHLVRELRLCGPIFYRWMFPFIRLNKVLKSSVKNHFYLEGCIEERYLEEESVEFCVEFARQSCTTAGLPKDHGSKLSGPLSAAIIKIHKKYLEQIYGGRKKTIQWLIGEHKRLFADWFQQKVNDEIENGVIISEMIRWLVCKPSFTVLTFDGYLVDGVRYFTRERDNTRVVQNSGVSLVANTVQVSSSKDLKPVESNMTFYGRIGEIRELDYQVFKAPLFLCRWPDNDRGVKIDDFGFTLVDLSRQGHKNDKYVSVDQVK